MKYELDLPTSFKIAENYLVKQHHNKVNGALLRHCFEVLNLYAYKLFAMGLEKRNEILDKAIRKYNAKIYN